MWARPSAVRGEHAGRGHESLPARFAHTSPSTYGTSPSTYGAPRRPSRARRRPRRSNGFRSCWPPCGAASYSERAHGKPCPALTRRHARWSRDRHASKRCASPCATHGQRVTPLPTRGTPRSARCGGAPVPQPTTAGRCSTTRSSLAHRGRAPRTTSKRRRLRRRKRWRQRRSLHRSRRRLGRKR